VDGLLWLPSGGGGRRGEGGGGADSLVDTEVPADIQRILEKVQRGSSGGEAEGGEGLEHWEVERLFEARGAAFRAVCAAADSLRQQTCGDKV
jgi:hypothetical protein